MSTEMVYAEIDVKSLKSAVDAILDDLIEDLDIQKVAIDESADFYWDCPVSEMYDMTKQPIALDVGLLRDDIDFVNLIKRGQGGDVSYNLIHVAPLLRYITEKIRR
ncbi:MAG: hypothetical protein ABSD96_11585 [Candidatus Korobacteraceae bacterium]|jgi:hypothetical protein